MSHSFQECKRCVMDSTAMGITFDDEGICNYCTDFLKRSSDVLFQTSEQKKKEFDSLVDMIRESGQGKKYDCIIGVSGGVDSSWVLVKAVEVGLRPLAVHMDNGWNSELAQNNIANLIQNLGVDLYTHVINWEEYKALMQSFFDADVIDIELLYDNAMIAVNYQQAAYHGLKYILAGTNQATEGMAMPVNWNWFKYDRQNIKALGQKFGNVRLKTFPSFGVSSFIWYEFIRGIRWTSFLDFIEFNKQSALDVLQKSYGYKPYPYKHYESVFTRFYQGYILPEKFKVDKRKLHLSTLIISRQMTREEASALLNGIPYPTIEELENDKRYFLKKMGWSLQQLQDYLSRPEVPHEAYPSEKKYWDLYLDLYRKVFKRK